VRVSFLHYQPDVTTDNLRGTNVNIRKQIKSCSFGKLLLQPAHDIQPQHRSNDSQPILQEVMEIHIPDPIQSHQDSVRILENKVLAKLNDWYGSNYLQKLNHILLVFSDAPNQIHYKGRNYLAYAIIRGKLSVYNNQWAISLSTLAHELGHNWNLHHAGEAGIPYADTTGYMGWANAEEHYPRSCYNAQKNWFLGWYCIRIGNNLFPSTTIPLNRVVLHCHGQEIWLPLWITMEPMRVSQSSFKSLVGTRKNDYIFNTTAPNASITTHENIKTKW
jgi:Gametolysin peptidase M11